MNDEEKEKMLDRMVTNVIQRLKSKPLFQLLLELKLEK